MTFFIFRSRTRHYFQTSIYITASLKFDFCAEIYHMRKHCDGVLLGVTLIPLNSLSKFTGLYRFAQRISEDF